MYHETKQWGGYINYPHNFKLIVRRFIDSEFEMKYMKKIAVKIVTVISIAIFAMTMLSSCGSLSALFSDPNFKEGFRQGWNSTAPQEYRY